MQTAREDLIMYHVQMCSNRSNFMIRTDCFLDARKSVLPADPKATQEKEYYTIKKANNYIDSEIEGERDGEKEFGEWKVSAYLSKTARSRFIASTTGGPSMARLE